MLGPSRSGARRTALALAAVVALASMLALAAAAQAVLAPCGTDLTCGTVTVPLDPSGVVPGTVSLDVERYDATGTSATGSILALAGGPGQSAVSLLAFFKASLAPLLNDYALVVFDARGVGHSSSIRCLSSDTAAQCAQELGAAAPLYATVDSVADIEAVRAALAIPKLSLYGVSYGTFTALEYARAYPTHVQRLVLDSTLPADGDPPLGESSLLAINRVYGSRCAVACPGPSPLAALTRAVGRPPYDARARTTGELAYVTIVESDLSPLLRAEIPAAFQLLAHGDPAALEHVYSIAAGIADEAGASVAGAPQTAHAPPAAHAAAAKLLDAVSVATECDDDRFPWPASAPAAQRIAAADRAFGSIPKAALAPFPGGVVLRTSEFQQCLTWPYAGDDPPRVSAPLPATPTLILSGEDDLRTPLADARALATQLPRATVLAVPNTGHAVLANDPTTCSAHALAAFFVGGSVVRCAPAAPQPVDPLPPRSLASLAATPRLPGQAGRVLRALVITLHHDVGIGVQYLISAGSGSGTLGGTIKVIWRGRQYYINLHAISYVPTVTVSGVLHNSAAPSYPGRVVVNVRGREFGTVTLLGDGVLTGTLGGRRFTLSLDARLAIIRQAGLGALPSD